MDKRNQSRKTRSQNRTTRSNTSSCTTHSGLHHWAYTNIKDKPAKNIPQSDFNNLLYKHSNNYKKNGDFVRAENTHENSQNRHENGPWWLTLTNVPSRKQYFHESQPSWSIFVARIRCGDLHEICCASRSPWLLSWEPDIMKVRDEYFSCRPITTLKKMHFCVDVRTSTKYMQAAMKIYRPIGPVHLKVIGCSSLREGGVN